MTDSIILSAEFDNMKDTSRFYSKMTFIDRTGTGEEILKIDDELIFVSVELLPNANVEYNRNLFKDMALVHNAQSITLNLSGEDQMVVK